MTDREQALKSIFSPHAEGEKWVQQPKEAFFSKAYKNSARSISRGAPLVCAAAEAPAALGGPPCFVRVYRLHGCEVLDAEEVIDERISRRSARDSALNTLVCGGRCPRAGLIALSRGGRGGEAGGRQTHNSNQQHTLAQPAAAALRPRSRLNSHRLENTGGEGRRGDLGSGDE
ncbi:hypothetical protein Efla_005841 [Eimeria flavescens]